MSRRVRPRYAMSLIGRIQNLSLIGNLTKQSESGKQVIWHAGLQMNCYERIADEDNYCYRL